MKNIILLTDGKGNCATLQTKKEIEEVKKIYKNAKGFFLMEDMRERHLFVIQCDLEEVGADNFKS